MPFCGSILHKNHNLMLEKRKWEYGNSILRFIFLIFASGRKLTFQHPTNEIQKIKHFHNLQKLTQNPQNQEGEAVEGKERSGTWDKEKEIQTVSLFPNP